MAPIAASAPPISVDWMSVGVGFSLLRIQSARLPCIGSLGAGEEQQGAVAADAQHAVGVVEQAEVARRLEGQLQHGMEKAVAAHEAFLRRIVDRHAVDGRRERPRDRISPGADGVVDALQRGAPLDGRGMGRGRAAPIDRIGLLAHELQLELPLAAQLVDQARHGVAAIAGALDQHGDADLVGLELLLARIAAQRQQPIARHRAADRDRPGRRRGLDGGIEHALPLPRALGGMALHDMAELVAEGGRQLGLVIEQGEQAARHEHIAAGTACALATGWSSTTKRELAGDGGLAHDLLADAIDIGLQRGVRIGRPDVALELARQGRRSPALPTGRRRGLRRNRCGACRPASTGEQREKYENRRKTTDPPARPPRP